VNFTILQNPSRLRFAIRVQPRSSRNRVAGAVEGVLRLQVSAPPVEGAANQAVVALLAELLGVRLHRVRLVSGDRARRKIVEIETPDPPGLAEKVAQTIGKAASGRGRLG